MSALKINAMAPDFTLGDFKLSEAVGKCGCLLLTFYKKTCPTCQFTYPFFEKIHKKFSGSSFLIIGIGQDPETREFSKTYGVTFRMISDTPTYDISKQYGLTVVPTAFLIRGDRKIAFLMEGFHKKELTGLIQKISRETKKPVFDLFEGQQVPELKPG